MDDFGEWAQRTEISKPLLTAKSDREIIDLFIRGEEIVKLQSGNIHRTLGGKHKDGREDTASGTICNIDLGYVKFDNTEHFFASHCSIRERRFSTKGVLVMNSQWYKKRRVAVRAHPSDGKVDLIYSNLSIPQYYLAAKRAESGSHLPHPDLRTQSREKEAAIFPRPMLIFADGSLIGRSSKIMIGVAHRAIKVVVQ